MLGYDLSRTETVQGAGFWCAALAGYRYRRVMPSPHLERKLKETLGDDAGTELAAMTDRIDPLRADIAELRHHTELLIERGLREQTRFFFAAWAVQMAAIVGLYGAILLR